MKKMTKWLVLFALVLSALGCALLFGCGGGLPDPPEVKNVTITADEGSLGKAGALHRVSYTAPEGCTIATSVQRGEAAATAADYAARDGGYYFYAEGEYTVTVYASKDGMMGSGSAKVTISAEAAFVDGLRIEAVAGETAGKAGALHVLRYTIAKGSSVDVEIKKDGSVTADAVFDRTANTLLFKTAGEYTVSLTATLGETSKNGEVTIEISDADAPEVEIAFDKNSAKEDEAVKFTRTAKFTGSSRSVSERFSVLYRKSTVGAYTDAGEETYTIVGDTFIPHVAGRWQLVYRATGEYGAEGEATADLTCTAAEMSLALATAGRHRIQTDQPTNIDYSVSGAAEKYNVTFDTHGNANVTATQGEGNSVCVTAAEADYFSVDVIYTHKVTTGKTHRITLDFYSVENLSYAPAWGEDPFGGMPGEVLTCMGHLLYFDAVSCGGVPRTLTAKDATFTVIENNVTATESGTGVDIMYAANDEAYPYVIVSNFDACVATGNFTLKMTLTDPYTGYSAVATKQFTVTPTTSNDTQAASVIRNYVEKYDFYEMGDMSYTDMAKDCRLNMVLTKTGTIMHRRNESWSLGGGNADFCRIPYETNAENCRLEFDFRLLGANPVSGEVWLGIGLRTVTANGWAGFFDVRLVSGKIAFVNGLDAKPRTERSFDDLFPAAEAGTAFSVRLDRRVSGNDVEYIAYFKTGAEGYREVYRCDYAKSSSGAGAAVVQYQFSHRNAGGCYAVEKVSVTDMGTV